MSGIFGTKAPLTSDLSLLLQMVILVILIVGVKFGKEKTMEGLKKHGNLMTLAVILNALGFLFVMGPSFVEYFSFPLQELSPVGIVSTSLHVFFGSLAEIFGIAFAFNKKPKNVRLWMRLAMSFWVIALILGFALYLQIAGMI